MKQFLQTVNNGLSARSAPELKGKQKAIKSVAAAEYNYGKLDAPAASVRRAVK